MRRSTERAVEAFLVEHWGVIDRHHAERIGVSRSQIDTAVRTGRWINVHRGVYRRSGQPLTVRGAALAACWTLGPETVISHQSAAYIWGLSPRQPGPPSVTVPGRQHPRTPGIEVHRSSDLDPRRTVVLRHLPLTDPLRTLADLGAVVTSSDELDDIVDRARLTRLVTVDGLHAELERLARRGRGGPPVLRQALERRGLIEGPSPSVLESRVSRLLVRWGIPVLDVETIVLAGRYRLDFLLRPRVALEVDGYAFHSSPEQKASDAARRADLTAAGFIVIEADWLLVARRPEELRRRILRVLDGRPRRTEA